MSCCEEMCVQDKEELFGYTRASAVAVALSVTKACAMMRLTDPRKPATDANTTSHVVRSLKAPKALEKAVAPAGAFCENL